MSVSYMLLSIRGVKAHKACVNIRIQKTAINNRCEAAVCSMILNRSDIRVNVCI